MTRSVESLWNTEREYSVGIDLDPQSGKKIERIDEINRGKGMSETDRPFVKMPSGMDIAIHTHPTIRSNWDRPSGHDVYNVLYRSLSRRDLDEAYILGPNRYWYRYYLIPKSENQKTAIWKRIKDMDDNDFDSMIEKEYNRIHRREMRLAHLNGRDRRKILVGRAKRSDFPKSELQKYQQQAIADRRSFHAFAAYLESEWNVKLERTKKEKGEMEFHYRPDE